MEEKTTISAQREALGECKKSEHAGLWLERYLPELNSPGSRKELLPVAINAISRSLNFYNAAFQRRQKLYDDKYRKTVKTDDNRLIIGLGNASVLETGLTLHHTYGTPIIPGSALKGLCAHHARERFFKWCSNNQRWLESEEESEYLNDAQYLFIFGNEKSGGHIIFHDAWIVPESLSGSLKADVMTPHHSDYYSQKGGCAPTDFDSPVPVPFLSVSGTFEIILSAASADADGWIDIVWTILKDALETRGIGGKTSSGYGRMI
ncbi:MAG: type III-B CRISPR module RAMP protein Cmr6 [Cystobacterineae bacterium]|nr:type III-B CRISPR module RAMP protein Cmr6 [Cystobacterineae bacterium]